MYNIKHFKLHSHITVIYTVSQVRICLLIDISIYRICTISLTFHETALNHDT